MGPHLASCGRATNKRSTILLKTIHRWCSTVYCSKVKLCEQGLFNKNDYTSEIDKGPLKFKWPFKLKGASFLPKDSLARTPCQGDSFAQGMSCCEPRSARRNLCGTTDGQNDKHMWCFVCIGKTQLSQVTKVFSNSDCHTHIVHALIPEAGNPTIWSSLFPCVGVSQYCNPFLSSCRNNCFKTSMTHISKVLTSNWRTK